MNKKISALFALMLGLSYQAGAKDYLSLTEQAFAENNWQEVIDIGSEWKDAEPADAAPYYFMSHAYFASYRPDEAYDCLKGCNERYKAEKFLPLAEEMSGKYPANSYLCVLLGNTYLEAERFDDALETLKKAVKIDSDYGGAYFIMGSVYEETSREKKAASAYKKGIKKDPDFLPNYEELGIYYSNQKKSVEKGEKIYLKGLKRNRKKNSTVRLHGWLARLYIDNGEFSKAIDIIEDGLRLRPEDNKLNRALGEYYAGVGRFSEAIEHYQELLKADWICCKSVIRGRLSDIIAAQRESKEIYGKK